MPRADAPPIRLPLLIACVALVGAAVVATLVVLSGEDLAADAEPVLAAGSPEAEGWRAEVEAELAALRDAVARMQAVAERLEALDARPTSDGDPARVPVGRSVGRSVGDPAEAGTDPDVDAADLEARWTRFEARLDERLARVIESLPRAYAAPTLERSRPMDEARVTALIADDQESGEEERSPLLLMTVVEIVHELGAPTQVDAAADAGADSCLVWHVANEYMLRAYVLSGYVVRVNTWRR